MNVTEKSGKDFDYGTILCLEAEAWNAERPSASQCMLRALAAKNRILYVDTRAGRGWKMREEEDNLFVLAASRVSRNPPGWLCRVIGRKLLRLRIVLAGRRLGLKRPVLWTSSAALKDLALSLRSRAQCLVYFKGTLGEEPPQPERGDPRDEALLRVADFCFFNQEEIFLKKRDLNRRIYLLPAAIDYDHFAEAFKPGNRPSDLRNVPSPIAGYAGRLEELDDELVEFLARENRAMSFVFLGEINPAVVERHQAPNLYFLGRKSREELPYYMRHFDVHCMAWHDKAVRSREVLSRRILERLATGKPIVAFNDETTTPWSDYVYLAGSYEEFSDQVREAVMEDEPELPAKRMNYAARHTWQQAAAEAMRLIGTPSGGARAAAPGGKKQRSKV